MSGFLRILLVEDDRATCEAAQALLEADGHRVTAFPDGESAVAELERTYFDLVITDFNLAGTFCGWDVIAAAKQRAVKTILMSAHSRESMRGPAAATPDRFVQKPPAVPLGQIIREVTGISLGPETGPVLA